MRKLLFLFVAMLMSAMCFAEEPLQLVLSTLKGERLKFDANSLVLTVDNGKLLVSNGTESQSFEISDLYGMSFDNLPVAVDDIEVLNEDGSALIYNVDGNYVGKFNSTTDALKGLKAGLYVVKKGDKSFKIRVK